MKVNSKIKNQQVRYKSIVIKYLIGMYVRFLKVANSTQEIQTTFHKKNSQKIKEKT